MKWMQVGAVLCTAFCLPGFTMSGKYVAGDVESLRALVKSLNLWGAL